MIWPADMPGIQTSSVNKLITMLLLTSLIVWGMVTAPFGWKLGGLPSDPVPVDAISGPPDYLSFPAASVSGYRSRMYCLNRPARHSPSRSAPWLKIWCG